VDRNLRWVKAHVGVVLPGPPAGITHGAVTGWTADGRIPQSGAFDDYLRGTRSTECTRRRVRSGVGR
jgi:hypothetical protein